MTDSADGIKREAYGFVVGEALIIIGGYLMGAGGALGHWVPLLGPFLIAAGLLLAVMLFVKVSKSLSKAHSMVRDAGIALQDGDRRIRESFKLLERQNKDIERLYNEVQKAERRINDVKQEIDLQDKKFRNDFERVFGHSSVFSRHNWANPLEKSLESIERRLKALEDAAQARRFRRPAGGWG